MKTEFLVAITQLCSERSLPKETVLQAVEQALVSAYKRNFGGAQNITAKIDPNSGKARIFATKEVVEQVHDRRIQISLDEAKRYDPMAQLGSTVQLESTPDDFGRIAAQTAKQVVLQKIREAERDSLFQNFAEREGEIVHGTVHTVDSNGITVNLGKIEGLLPKSEQIPTERYRHNQKVRALVTEVNRTSKGPQVVLSRTHRNLLRRLLELEVPEIYNGLVEIKAIAREAGQRSKVAVHATQDGLDPVGACVGQRGVRIQAIVNELTGERIDVIEWRPDPAEFIAKALSPAQALSVSLAEEPNGDKVATVVVQDKQLSLAIGKEGQNARLAAKLTGWRIDIKSEAQIKAEHVFKTAPAPVPAAAPEPAAEIPAAEPQVQAEPVVAEVVVPALLTEPIAAEPVAEVARAAEVIAPTLAAAEAAVVHAAEPAPAPAVAAAPAVQPEAKPEAKTEGPAGAEPELSFEEALAEFEAGQEGEGGEDKPKKRKDVREKGRVLEFDEKLGQVVIKKKHKGGRTREEWFEPEE